MTPHTPPPTAEGLTINGQDDLTRYLEVLREMALKRVETGAGRYPVDFDRGVAYGLVEALKAVEAYRRGVAAVMERAVLHR